MIFVIPFPTVVDSQQENQEMMNGGNFDKNILAFFVMFALFLIIKEGKWRDFTLIGTFMIGYLIIIAFSAFAQSERFHLPSLPFEIMFAAYGISRMDKKTVKYFNVYTLIVFGLIIGWSWFKLSGRGLT